MTRNDRHEQFAEMYNAYSGLPAPASILGELGDQLAAHFDLEQREGNARILPVAIDRLGALVAGRSDGGALARELHLLLA